LFFPIIITTPFIFYLVMVAIASLTKRYHRLHMPLAHSLAFSSPLIAIKDANND